MEFIAREDPLGPLTYLFLVIWAGYWLAIISMYVLPIVGAVLIVRDIRVRKFNISTAVVLGLIILFVIPYWLVIVFGWQG